jgi:hypothetical protein
VDRKPRGCGGVKVVFAVALAIMGTVHQGSRAAYAGTQVPAGTDANTAPGWHRIPGSALQSVCPKDPAIQAAGGCRGVIDAWSGGIADTSRNRLVIWGGGHGDYFGNEVYALNVSAGRMERLSEPSPVSNVSACPEAYVDGLPSSRHTYEGLSYIAHADTMFAFGGSKANCGFFSGSTWTLDLATMKWRAMEPGGTKPAGGPGQVSDYDPNSKLVYLHDYVSGFYAYNFAANAWKQVMSDSYGIDYHMSGAIDPKRKLFVLVGGLGNQGGGLAVFNVGGASSRKATPRVDVSCRDPFSASSPGVAYDSALEKIVIWPNYGSAVYLLDDGTWTCQRVQYPGGPAERGQAGAPSATTGTFGRFRYFPEKDIFVLVNQAGSDAYTLSLGLPGAAAAAEKKRD